MKFSKMIAVMIALMSLSSISIAEDLVVGAGKKVTLDYTLTVDNKEVETSIGKTPLSYVVGARNIIPGLEAQLNGMKINEEKVIDVAAKDAYGEVDPKAFKEFPRSALPYGSAQVGKVIQATAPDGSNFPAVIAEIKGNMVVLNFNHPLAGKELSFKVKILDVSNAPGMFAATPSPKTQAAKKCEGVVGGAEWTACMGLK